MHNWCCKCQQKHLNKIDDSDCGFLPNHQCNHTLNYWLRYNGPSVISQRTMTQIKLKILVSAKMHTGPLYQNIIKPVQILKYPDYLLSQSIGAFFLILIDFPQRSNATPTSAEWSEGPNAMASFFYLLPSPESRRLNWHTNSSPLQNTEIAH